MKDSRKKMRKRRYHAFYVAALAGVFVSVVSAFFFLAQALTLGSITFFVVYLWSSLVRFPGIKSDFLMAHAAETDDPVRVIFGATFIVLAVSVYSLFQVINASGAPDPFPLALAVLAVVLGWFMIHSMAAHHYAFEYYDVPDDGDGGKRERGVVGGLDFPSGKTPDGMSFLYFSYVIGMTAQVADVNVSSVRMQRLVMWHGIFSFFFNTVIIAATVNLAVSLGH